MKRHLIGILLVLVLLLSLSACTAANAVQTLDIVEDKVEAKPNRTGADTHFYNISTAQNQVLSHIAGNHITNHYQ